MTQPPLAPAQVALLDPGTGRFPDSYAPPSVVADKVAAQTARVSAVAAADEASAAAAVAATNAALAQQAAESVQAPTQQMVTDAVAARATTVVLTPNLFTGVDPTGVTDCSAAVQAVINAIPNGAVLEVPPGRYRVAGLSTVGKTWHLRMLPGCELVQASNVTVLSVAGAWDAPYQVSALGASTDFVGGETWQMTTVTLASTPPWATGDIVKLYSDDVLWDGRPGDVANPKQPYEGEFATVHKIVGTVVWLKGPARATYVSNVRIARMQKVTFSITGGKSGTEAANLATWNTTQVFMKSLYQPRISGFRVSGGGGSALSFSSCYQWIVDGGSAVEDLMNSAAAGQFGYGISDSAGEGGQAIGWFARNVRHAFTDGAPNITAPSSNPGDYGRSRNHKISGKADGCTSAAWDTHHGGSGHVFDVEATRSTIGAQIRGTGHTFNNLKVTDCVTGVRAYTEPVDNVRSFGHKLVNPDITATGDGIQTDIYQRDDSRGPTLTVSGGRVRAGLYPVHAMKGTVVLRDGVDVGYRGASTGTTNGIYLENSACVVDGATVDMTALGSAGSAVRGVRLADAACSITGSGLRVLHGTLAGRMDAAIAGSSWAEAGAVNLDGVTLDAAVVDVMRAVTAASRVSYRVGAGPVQVGTVDGSTIVVAAPPRKSSGYLGSFGTNPMIAALVNTTTTTLNAANDCFLIPVVPDEDVTVSTLTWLVGGATSGNYDIGIYTEAGARLTSKGSTAWPAASSQVDSAVTPVTLKAGVRYWLAFAGDNATGTFRGVLTAGLAQLQRLDGLPWARRVTASFPLPATINPGATVAARLPMITCKS